MDDAANSISALLGLHQRTSCCSAFKLDLSTGPFPISTCIDLLHNSDHMANVASKGPYQFLLEASSLVMFTTKGSLRP